jgi:hypothetical protein
VDAKRFDEITVALAGPESSRRSLLRRVGGGGLAALIVGLGLIGTDVGEVEAGGRKRRRHHRRRRRRGGSSGSTSTGTGTGTGGTATGGAGGSATGGAGGAGGTLAPVNGAPPPVIPNTCTTVNGVALGGAVQIGTACTGGSAASCATGFCTETLCATCPSPCSVNGVEQCCGSGAFCLSAAGVIARVGACGVCA